VPLHTGIALSGEIDESSGLTVGGADPSVLWTHNDDGSALFAIDRVGTILGRWSIQPRLRDWEDIAAAPCPESEWCLYLADTGDNAERRPAGTIRIVRVPEPRLGDAWPVDGEVGLLRGEAFPLRLPDGPRDIEALFVLPEGELRLVTKGRNHGVAVYRYPPPLRPDTVEMAAVQELFDGAQPLANQVTGASASRDGSTVAVRTYQSLGLYRVAGDSLALMENGLVNLRSLAESQGEAVALDGGGQVLLSSEGGFLGTPPSMNILRCGI